MKSVRYLGILVLLLGVILLRTTPVQADPPSCTQCSDGSHACDFFCLDSEGGNSNCGEAGYSCETPTCHANYQVIDVQTTGTWAVDDSELNTCVLMEATTTTYSDANDCPGSEDFDQCTEGVGGSYNMAGWCCTIYQCGGQSCS